MADENPTTAQPSAEESPPTADQSAATSPPTEAAVSVEAAAAAPAAETAPAAEAAPSVEATAAEAAPAAEVAPMATARSGGAISQADLDALLGGGISGIDFNEQGQGVADHKPAPARTPAAPVAPRAAAPAAPVSAELRRILRIEVPVIVKLADKQLALSEIINLTQGSIVEFSKSADKPLELLANNKPIGFGMAVKVGEKFGLKIDHILPLEETLRRLGT